MKASARRSEFKSRLLDALAETADGMGDWEAFAEAQEATGVSDACAFSVVDEIADELLRRAVRLARV